MTKTITRRTPRHNAAMNGNRDSSGYFFIVSNGKQDLGFPTNRNFELKDVCKYHRRKNVKESGVTTGNFDVTLQET